MLFSIVPFSSVSPLRVHLRNLTSRMSQSCPKILRQVLAHSGSFIFHDVSLWLKKVRIDLSRMRLDPGPKRKMDCVLCSVRTGSAQSAGGEVSPGMQLCCSLSKTLALWITCRAFHWLVLGCRDALFRIQGCVFHKITFWFSWVSGKN